MTSLKRSKKNQTISFEDDIHALLKKEADKHYNNNFSSALNNIIRYTLGLEDKVKKEIASFAKEKYLEYEQKANDEKGFHKETFSNYSKQYEKFFEILLPAMDIKTSEEDENMQRIEMKNSYLICPKDWIQVVPCNEKLHTYAYVIEFLNGKEFNLPHFFFTTQEAELNDGLQKKYLELAASKSEKYFEVWSKYPTQLSSDIGGVPIPGFFEIPKLGTTDFYPCGAMVIDKENTEKGGD